MSLKFTQYEDMTNIVDSMELDTGTTICELETDKGYCTIEVRGEVSVDYKGVRYKYPSEFPEELKKLIHEHPYDWDVYAPSGEGNNEPVGDIDVHLNNWFEAFWGRNPKEAYDYDVVDVEGKSSSQLLDLCFECLKCMDEEDREGVQNASN